MKRLPIWLRLVAGTACLSVALFLGLGMLAAMRLQFDSVSLRVEGSDKGFIQLPFSSSDHAGMLQFTIIVNHKTLSPTVWDLTGDDTIQSLSVNGKAVDLSNVPPDRRGYVRGPTLDLGAFLVQGLNTVVVEVPNAGGPGGFKLKASPQSPLSIGFAIISGAFFLAGLWFFLSLAGFSNWYRVLILAGLLLRLVYLGGTPWAVRGWDQTGHFEYINHILERGKLPLPDEGFLTYHPPLYYLLAAGTTMLAKSIGISDAEDQRATVQLLAMLLQIVFLCFGLRILQDSFQQRGPAGALLRHKGLAGVFARYRPDGGWVPFLAAVLFVFWPANILNSVRVGNDVLLYPLMAAAILYAQRWYQKPASREFWLFLGAATLATITKTNGVVLFAVGGGLVAVRWYLDRKMTAVQARDHLRGRKKAEPPVAAIETMALASPALVKPRAELRRNFRTAVQRIGLVTMVAVFAVTLAMGSTIVARLAGRNHNPIIANAKIILESGLRVENRAQNYLWFDLQNYAREPFTSTWSDQQGRQWFWNFYLKSSMFGEFSIKGELADTLALVMGLCLLGMILWMLNSFRWADRLSLLTRMPLILTGAVIVAAAIFIRVLVPASCTGDFRYSLPLVIALSVFWADSLYAYRAKGRKGFAVAGVVLAVLFVLCTIVIECLAAST